MSMTAENILKLPPEQQSDAIEKSAEHLSMDDIQVLSEAMIRKVDQNLKACTGFANSQKAVQERKKSEVASAAARAPVFNDEEEPTDFVSVAQGKSQPRGAQSTSRPQDFQPMPEAETSGLDEGITKAEKRNGLPAPMLLTRNQVVTAEDEMEVEVEDDLAASDGIPEIVETEMDEQRDSLVNSMLAAARTEDNGDAFEAPVQRKSIGMRLIEGIGTLQFRLMPILWGTAGGWLLVRELISSLSFLNAILAGIVTSMLITLMIGKMTRQKALVSTLMSGAAQCAIGMHMLGLPNSLEAASMSHLTVATFGAVCLLLAGGLGIRCATKAY